MQLFVHLTSILLIFHNRASQNLNRFPKVWLVPQSHTPWQPQWMSPASASTRLPPSCKETCRATPEECFLGWRLRFLVTKTRWLYKKGSKQLHGLVVLCFKKNKNFFLFQWNFTKLIPILKYMVLSPKDKKGKNNYQLEIIYCPYKAAEFCIKSLVMPLEVCSPFHLRKVFYILV